MARLQEQYVNEIAPALNKKFGYKSVMQIPKLDKVIINVAAGEAKENAKVIDAIVADLGQITGQKAIVCKARKSVANFKLREGMPIGAKVTLRGERMYEFVDPFLQHRTRPCPRSSAASTATVLTVAATLHAASRSRSSSPRSTSRRSMQSAAWMSALSPLPRLTKRARSC